MKIGSLFSGIGGFELGLERAIPGSKTIWQVEQDKYCQKVLKKHWPDAKIYDDVCQITKHNAEPVDIICGGFPCQDISLAGKQKGIIKNETRSGLWWEMHRIISEIRPRIAVLENVAAITNNGIGDVLGSLSQIGYDAEWTIVSAQQFGAPHIRKRWFCVAYPNSERSQTKQANPMQFQRRKEGIQSITPCGSTKNDWNDRPRNYWEQFPNQSPIRGRNDGISYRMDRHRIKALGNAIVPQCSEWIGKQIINSNILEMI
jgi:DNA (cytosine-5)-methyltransferase 1